ncbi:unnamed protein product [Musa acuminata var. zebrina]
MGVDNVQADALYIPASACLSSSPKHQTTSSFEKLTAIEPYPPMASRLMLLAVLVIVAAAAMPQSSMAANYTVGDASGWSPEFNSTAWTDGKMFMVGDNLVFNYKQGIHNVMQVGGADFKACNASAATINTFTSGGDVVPLDAPGKRWYICGFGDHCSRGQKLVVNVMSGSVSPASPPSSSSISRNVVASYAYQIMVAAVAVTTAMIFAR